MEVLLTYIVFNFYVTSCDVLQLANAVTILRLNLFQCAFFSSALRPLLLMRLTTITFFTLLIGFAILAAFAPEVSSWWRRRRRRRHTCTSDSGGCYAKCNGCNNPSGVVGWTRTFTPHCNKHDVCYYCVRNYELLFCNMQCNCNYLIG